MSNNSDDDVIIHADVIHNGSLTINQVDAFPPNPQVVTLIVKDDTLWGYLNIQGVTAWCPFAKIPMNFVYKQETAAFTWIVQHNLDASDTWVQVKDTLGNPVTCGKQDINRNSFSLHFTEPTAGAALVIANTELQMA